MPHVHSYIYFTCVNDVVLSLHSPHAYRVVYGLVRSYILPLTSFMHITRKYTVYMCYMRGYAKYIIAILLHIILACLVCARGCTYSQCFITVSCILA